jgi:hypothetical protein
LYGTKNAEPEHMYDDSRFIVVREGIIKDTVTGLIWEQGQETGEVNWVTSMDYVKKLRLGGYSDWRLPTKEEWEELILYARKQQVSNNMGSFFDKQGFKNTKSMYWSSTANEGTSGYAWYVDLFYGNVSYGSRTGDYAYIRAVRSELSPNKWSRRTNNAIKTHSQRVVR